MMSFKSTYYNAQHGMALLKEAIYNLLEKNSPNGLRNVDIGKALGIYSGHKGHEGHISRTLLEIMQNEGVVEQKNDKLWYLKRIPEDY